MKKEYKMTDKELLEMIAIAQAPATPVMLIGSVQTGNEKQESANAFWRRLGEQYGFEWDTVDRAPDKGYNFFMATPKPESTNTKVELTCLVPKDKFERFTELLAEIKKLLEEK